MSSAFYYITKLIIGTKTILIFYVVNVFGLLLHTKLAIGTKIILYNKDRKSDASSSWSDKTAIGKIINSQFFSGILENQKNNHDAQIGTVGNVP